MALLITAVSLVILTAVGIVLSMVFETLNFVSEHPWQDFFLGGSWAPDFCGNSELSILPLLWVRSISHLWPMLVAIRNVVLGAVAIARFSGNPFEAMSSITTRIMSQITGDTDFASPEALAAFALCSS